MGICLLVILDSCPVFSCSWFVSVLNRLSGEESPFVKDNTKDRVAEAEPTKLLSLTELICQNV